MTKDDELPPDPHIQFSFINRGASWPSLLSEFIDNSLDEAAGNAAHVVIQIRDDSVSIWDDGNGIEDINALGRLGASGSFHHEGNIGQFGVGAKTWLCRANKLDVTTLRDGRLHKHIFDATPVVKALEKKRTPPWLVGYRGVGKPAINASFTMITLRNIRRGSGSIIFGPVIIAELEKAFWPALRNGRQITIEDLRKRSKSPVLRILQPLDPPNLSDTITFESTANGRRYKATIGILTESIGSYSGLWCGYLFRNICIAKTLATRAVPPRIHGQVELSADWRHCLSNYKDEIIIDREELLLDIEEKAKNVLDLAEEYAEDIQLAKISAVIEGNISKALLESLKAKKRRERGGGGGVVPEPDPDNPIPEIKTKPERKEGTEALDKTQASTGIKLAWSHLKNDMLYNVGVSGRTITVTLNRDCPKLEAQRLLPRYPGIYLAMGTAIAMHCLELTCHEIEFLYSGMLRGTEGSESHESMMKAILVWWGFAAEEKEQAEAV